ncbi:22759_t:CDS:2 [Gigaspora margarita]|uniref:22759_t:CDS:1 n=1 Tax=Gigaspora margarita TaxID=4874 RepID=A0ABN7V360_GIGMA|nr:22759_t:CDS:2 [Gigaspora margarita]
MSSNYNDPYNSYISQLNILNPVNLPEMSQEDLDAHLEFWSNAQFTFEVQQPNMNLMEDTFDVDTKMEQDALITAQPTMLTQQDTSSISDTSQAQQTIYHPILSYPTATVTDNVIKDDVAMSPGATSKSTTTGITNPPSRKNSSSKGSKTDSNVIHTDSQASQDPDLSAKLAAEEDKRRRNTAASARFRVKKKIREQALERTVKEMTTKAETLEGRVKELEMEIKWLRSLVVEKDARLLDIERPDKKHKSVTENKSTEESIKSESNDKSNKKVRSQDTK